MGTSCTFQLLAPANTQLTANFTYHRAHEQSYYRYLSSMQQLRGRSYLSDGAIQPHHLDEEGRFHMPGDEDSWHLLLVDETDAVIGCVKYLVHAHNVSYHRLKISQSTQANDAFWSERVRRAVEADLRRVREEKLNYVEVGGWALAEHWRGTRAALEIMVGSFALSLIWGGAVGSCTATARHSSASMLRRIGGESFETAGEVVPAYFDPHYDCQMELLRFDYRSPNKRFLPLITSLKAALQKSSVLSAQDANSTANVFAGEATGFLHGFQPAYSA